MKKGRIKRFLALIMAGTLSCASVPYTVLAEEPNAGAESAAENNMTADGGETAEAAGDFVENNTADEKEAAAGSTAEDSTSLKKWDFDDGTADGWDYNSGWNFQYDGGDNTSVENENNMLKVNADYSANADSTWSQLTLTDYPNPYISLTGANQMSFDFYFNPELLGAGTFKVKTVIQNTDWGEDVSADLDIDIANAADTDVISGYKKVNVTVSYPTSAVSAECPCVALQIIGSGTGYKGAFYLDNITVLRSGAVADRDVNSTIPIDKNQDISVKGNTLVTMDADGKTENTAINTEAVMVDPDATEKTKQTYAYLKAVGKSDSVLFGHQNDTRNKAGALASGENISDTYDITGSIAAVVGIDGGSLTGDEYTAAAHNARFGTSFPETQQGNISAGADAVNRDIAQGAVITLSLHMPNFSVVSENSDYKEGDPSYTKYDFSQYSPNVLTGDVMNQILPGGQYNEKFNAYLDMVADFASQVDGAILFRPLHENTGSWFWWGAAFCDAPAYKNVYKYVVTYLRDMKNIHNLIYVYSPGSEAASEEEFAERYPGDDYVDMVGFDMYHNDITENDGWFERFENELNIVNSFAEHHGKLIAVTETGMATSTPDEGSSQTALHATGNQQKDWYEKMLNAVSGSHASYFMLWANWGKNSAYYTPYVDSINEDGTLRGHEMLDNFISYYNDPRSIFAANQLSALASMPEISAKAVSEGATGFITSPVSRSRVLEMQTLTASVHGKAGSVRFALTGDHSQVTLEASGKDGTYTADLTEDDLKKLGEYAGTISLVIDGNTVDTINALFNLAPAEEDPYEIDDFENYYGVDSMLTAKWTTNKDSGSNITLSLDTDHARSGSYALKFEYDETATGWAGATISKEVDWSDCNALQFYTEPDGKNQKVVIQITANNNCYEAYLQNYDAYRSTTEPMLVTIPFSEFVARDIPGNPAGGLADDKGSISSFGLWVNAISDSDAVKTEGKAAGTIYYDKITAVSSDAKEASFKKLNESETAEMYRVYNPNSGEHFFTSNADEKNHLVSLGWRDEGIGWTTPVKSDTPVYRLYNKNGGEHHYTVSREEREHLISLGWNDEGIGWYSAGSGEVPVYRVYNKNAFANNHHYTSSREERDYLVKIGWNDEGIGWYAHDQYRRAGI